MVGLIVFPASTTTGGGGGDGGPVVTQDGPTTAPLSWQWTSWDGQVWNLTDLASPVIKLKGATGAGQVDPEHTWFDAAQLDGSSWQGARVGRGEVFLPLMVTGADSVEFMANHDAFMRSLDPRKEGTLRVTRPDGQWREIDCRYQSGADLTIDFDPVMAHRATYGITWATADPYWRGELIGDTYVFPYVAPLAYLNPPGPPIYINPARSLSEAVVSNPGDVDTYPVWQIAGPFTGFSVGVGDSLVSMTLTKALGEWVEIDTTPGQATIIDESDEDQWLTTTARKFKPIPPGDNVPVVTTIQSPGAGTAVTLTITPRYRGAW